MRTKSLATLLLGAGLLIPLHGLSGDIEKSYWGRGNQYLPDAANPAARKPQPAAAGLMVKLLQVQPDGSTRYVSTRKTFASGDRFKLEVRPNIQGYVYLFNQEEGGERTLVYPVDAAPRRVDQGQKLQLPGKDAFEFDDRPGRERLTLVLAKAPIEADEAGKKFKLNPIQVGGKGQAVEETQKGKGIVIVAPEDRYEGGRAQLVYTLELKHE